MSVVDLMRCGCVAEWQKDRFVVVIVCSIRNELRRERGLHECRHFRGWSDGGGSSGLCQCPAIDGGKHEDWCPAREETP